jgi:amino acid adenylation domain-containing protein
VELPVVDLGGLEPEAREAEGRRLAGEEALRPFDLAHGPLLRARLLRLEERDHVLLLTVHHIVFDGWSAGILNSELAAHYRAFVAGQPPSLPPLPLQYADFAYWQRRWLSGERLQRELAYWKARMDPLPPRLRLPTLRAHRSSQGFRGAAHVMGVEESLRDGLRALARSERVTLFVVLLAAFKSLLFRYTGQEDVVVGVPVASRPRDQLERLIGLFANTLAVRTDLSGDPSFRTVMERVKEVTAEAFEHEALPFEKLVEELNPGRSAGSGNPIFQVAFALQNAPSDPVELPDLTFSLFETDVRVTRLDLEVHVFEHAGGLATALLYNPDLLEPETVEAMGRHYRRVLEAVVAAPDTPLADLSLVDAGKEEQRLLVDWNTTGRAYPRESTLDEIFREQAERHRDAPALEFDDRALTYGELDRLSNRLGRYLTRLGVGPEVRVGLCLERSADRVMAMLAIVKAGAAYVPLDPGDPAERLAVVARDAALGGVVTRNGLAERLSALDVPVVRLDADGEAVEGESDEPFEAGSSPDSLAYVIYTSGSTGAPKGVAVPQRAVVRLVRGTDYISLDPSDRVVQASNASFDAATFEIWGALLNGARLLGLGRDTALSPRGLARHLRESQATVLFLTTALFNRVVREEPAAFGCLRVLLFGGEAVDPRWVKAALEAGPPRELLHVYGPTENTTFSTWQRVTGLEDGASTVPIGRPLANGRAYVLDPRLRPVPVGIVGELFLGGDGLARGYLGRPDLTAEAFLPDPFSAEPGGRLYRTGDRVRLTRDGAIEFLGRVDHQVKLRGFRIELREVELALLADPRVREVVALTRTDEAGEGQLVAYLSAREGHSLSPDELRQRARAALPPYMVPSAFVVLPSLPLTPNGKLDRRALPAPQRESGTGRAPVAPRTELEEQIAAAWREVLHLDEVGVHDNFFDQGGHSLRLIELHRRLGALPALGGLRVVDLFEHPTIASLAAHAVPETQEGGGRATSAETWAPDPAGAEGVAIVGMAGRFPGAGDVDELWRQLREGVESISRFTEEELEEEGIPAAVWHNPRYVSARGVLSEADRFDAAFFGYTPREAEMMDPQQRVFLEAAWAALESAGHLGDRASLRTGVFAGASANTYLPHLAAQPGFLDGGGGGLALLISSGGDFLTTRVSYKLDLRGPSVDVQTACSTSLVAVHMACHSLLRGECDLALAGGVSVGVPLRGGYLHEEGGIFSPDGHCRTFDERARGTVPGSGVGVVVLRRLGDALRDGDTITAVIRGSAVNNDGALRVGYTAPGVEGQAEVIARAQAAAGVDPASIGYVEAHGTGTALGDPIEIEALQRVFGTAAGGPPWCAIGSLKSNMGHLDAAAGVAGLIKTALVLKNKEIPPSLHFESPNPRIDFAGGAFRVSAEGVEWPSEGRPRRAAVSSFGMGGTNAHAVLEEAPSLPPTSPPAREAQLLVLSARTPRALETAAAALAAHLGRQAEVDLADVAHTLQEGRRSHRHRRAVLARDVGAACRALAGEEPGLCFEGRDDSARQGVVFVLPGQGSQHLQMGRELYAGEPVFRDALDRCAEGFREDLGVHLRDLLYAEGDGQEDARRRLGETAVAQAALFAVEWSLSRLLESWGVRPAALLGHSLGELVAATVAGVFSFEDALVLVAARGRLMQEQPRGAMLAVFVGEEEARTWLEGELALAAVNGPSQCVVSGPSEVLASLEARLQAGGVGARRLRTSHAFHSPMMEAVVTTFRDRVARVERRPPRVPFVSNITGTWITDAQAVDPAYWGRQLRETVRFADGVEALGLDGNRVALQVGPGRGTAELVRGQGGRHVVVTLPDGRGSRSSSETLLEAVGRLWVAGVAVEWAALRGQERRRKIPLPTYPFERQRHWFTRPPSGPVEGTESGRHRPVEEWFYRPTWRSAAPRMAPGLDESRWLVFEDATGLGEGLARRIEEGGSRAARVRPGESFGRRGDGVWTVRPGEAEDYEALVRALRDSGAWPERVAHCWGVTHRDEERPLEQTLDLGFYSLVFFARALGSEGRGERVEIVAVTTGMQEVGGEGLAHPEKATLLGPCRVIPQEHPWLACRAIDVPFPGAAAGSADLDRLARECGTRGGPPVVALRGAERWVPTFAPLRLENTAPAPRLRDGGVYLLTGGVGGIGFSLARFLARTRRARLALVGRTELPPRQSWDGWLAQHGDSNPTSRRIQRVRALEEEGGTVLLLRADVSDARALEEAFAQTEARFGPVDGVVHAAGVPGGGMVALKTREAAERVLAPKVPGTLALAEVLEDRSPDFVVLCSSLAAVLGGPGQVDYCAANAFQDAFARSWTSRGGPFVVSLNWDTWREAGMAVETELPPDLARTREAWLATGEGIGSAEGAEAFARSLGQPLPQLLVSTVDLSPRLGGEEATASAGPGEAAARPADRPRDEEAEGISAHGRPRLDVAFLAPRTPLEQAVAGVWRELLGFDRVGVHDGFFDLGGHSLLATQVVNRLRETFHVPLKLEAFFQAPTVEGLAQALVAAEPVPGQALEVAQLISSVEELSEQELSRVLAASEGEEGRAG